MDKKNKKHLITGIINLIAGSLFILNAIIEDLSISKYLYLFAAICLIISGLGFLYEYNKKSPKE